ncbi:hypothetical protein CG885_27355 [Salmonella enterica]|nr:hypothetical protein [Salmonella enterica]
MEALKSNFLFSSEFNFHVKDIGDVHEKSSIFKDDGYTQEYRDNWWGWVNQEDPSSDHSYLDFPFPERVLKNKP